MWQKCTSCSRYINVKVKLVSTKTHDWTKHSLCFKYGKISLLRNMATVSNNLFLIYNPTVLISNWYISSTYPQYQGCRTIRPLTKLHSVSGLASSRAPELPAVVLSMRSDSPERIVDMKRFSLVDSTSADLIHLIIS